MPPSYLPEVAEIPLPRLPAAWRSRLRRRALPEQRGEAFMNVSPGLEDFYCCEKKNLTDSASIALKAALALASLTS